MDFLANMALGFETAVSPTNLLMCFVGVFLGTFIGVLPGIGSLAAVSMLLPISFYLDPVTALIMLAGVYYGAEYGGSTASILLNLPGTPSSAVTCLDGYPMAKQGRAGQALFMTTIASFVGGLSGILLLMAFAPMIAAVALEFGASEYFALVTFGLVAAAAVANGPPIKGVAMVVLGLMLGAVGTDINSSVPRFTQGQHELYDGLNLVALAMGLFGVSEIIASIMSIRTDIIKQRITLRSMLPTRDDVVRSILPMLRGAGIGSVFGTLPGTGQTIASFVSYATEKRVAKDPSRFGKGAIEGISGPETANNAAVQTAFIPTLTIGIPGSATMALMMGALMIHGVAPGPLLMVNQPHIFWGLVVSFFIGNFILVILNIPLIGIWVRILQVPYKYLYPSIIVLLCVGVYSVNNSLFDVGTLLLFGVVGYVMRLLEFEPAPLLIGFVLGPMLEENLRRALLMGRGNPMALIDRPISSIILALTLALLVWILYAAIRTRASQRRNVAKS